MSEQNLFHSFKLNNAHSNFNISDMPFDFQQNLNTAGDQRKAVVVLNTSKYPPTTTHPLLPSIITNSTTTDLLRTNALQQQWEKNVSRSAIIIKGENEQTLEVIKTTHQSDDDYQIPKHIVSPEAIREALKEELEEAMGKTTNKPFSKFASFQAIKQCQYSSTVIVDHVSDDDSADNNISPSSFLKAHLNDNYSLFTQAKRLKKPPNAYLLFNKDMRCKLLKESSKISVAEISKKVGDQWRSLPDDKHQFYIEKALLLKEEHLRKYPNFMYTRRSKAEISEAKKYIEIEYNTLSSMTENNSRKRKKRRKQHTLSDGRQRDPRGRKKKRDKHPLAPKHPMSAYLYFLTSVYPQMSLEFPGSTVGPISKSISRAWHAMSPDEQLPWKHKAECDKARYAHEMEIYMANHYNASQAEEKTK